ncbi:hypothetical protein CPB84DRAFT_1697733, partial [Gymnopilus junonius]
RLNNSRLPGYPKALKLLQDPDHKDPVLLDIGCCFGNDTRKFIIDGWPAQEVIASDLREGMYSFYFRPIRFWQCGHELFNSTPSSFPVTFIQGDIFDPAFLSLAYTSSNPNSTSVKVESQPTRPNLSTLKSLTPLLHRVSAIHASALFHLFSETQQLELAQRLAALLLPQKGSIIFGTHVARREKGFRKSAATPILMFCHSPSSWRQMWVEQVFNGSRSPQVRVEAELVHYKWRGSTTRPNCSCRDRRRWDGVGDAVVCGGGLVKVILEICSTVVFSFTLYASTRFRKKKERLWIVVTGRRGKVLLRPGSISRIA